MTTWTQGFAPKSLGRTLHDITQLLESSDGAEERVQRVLGLLRVIVPYDECAMLEAGLGYGTRVVMATEPAPDGRDALTRTLLSLLGQLVEPYAPASSPPASLHGLHLAVPLIGLDEIIGILFVRSWEGRYTKDHLRALSIVGAKLAAYVMTRRARATLAQLARERDDARRAAEAANRAKDDLLALVSHELKKPLSSILVWAHVLHSATGDVAARARAITELERSLRIQAKLIDDILDLACVASAEVRLNLRAVEPAGLIKTTVEALRLEAERKSIRLECHLNKTAMPMLLDPDRIGRVVGLLVANAVKLTPTGGHVEVRLERTAGYARIQVSDTGSGIRSQTLPYVFDPLPRPNGDGGRDQGDTEVGLAIVKEVVELHGGRVRAESAGPEQGATVTMELPRLLGGEAAALVSAGDLLDSNQLAGVRVLLVEDDLDLRESFRLVLRNYGAEVMTVPSAPEAIVALQQFQADVLLLCDLATHDGAVHDLMSVVMARSCSLPVGSISAWRLDEEAREPEEGFRFHLAKPVDVRALIHAVANLAGRTSVSTSP